MRATRCPKGCLRRKDEPADMLDVTTCEDWARGTRKEMCASCGRIVASPVWPATASEWGLSDTVPWPPPRDELPELRR